MRDDLESELGAPLAPLPPELEDPAEGAGALLWPLVASIVVVMLLGIFG